MRFNKKKERDDEKRGEEQVFSISKKVQRSPQKRVKDITREERRVIEKIRDDLKPEMREWIKEMKEIMREQEILDKS